MAENENDWRALADALAATMGVTGVGPDGQYVRETAQRAVEWLRRHGYTIAQVSPADRKEL